MGSVKNLSKKILVTGGAGYIGSTVCSALIDHDYVPVILDNLSQGDRSFTKGRIFYEGDIADRSLIKKICAEHGPFAAVVHCAARIIVPESVTQPELYYRENVTKSLEMFAALRDAGERRLVFSSSAAVYDHVEGFMVREDSPIHPSSPYARTKSMMELILQDFCHAYGMSAISLRYFNPVGADPKLRTGPYAKNPTHILGRMVEVALGRSPQFEITGTSWPTRDGSGIRDYIHVWDLAMAHVHAIKNFDQAMKSPTKYGPTIPNYKVINLGTGRGVTVKEFVAAFETVNGKLLPKKESPPRPGDVAGSFANADTARELIGWQAALPLTQGIDDALKWSKKFLGV
jgi:UDP-glucose 4-epimerase